jgi:hypothetical protein
MRLEIGFAIAILLSLYTVSACDELYPFVDINDVTSIRVSENRILFTSKNGFRSLNLKSGEWNIGFYDHPKPEYKPSGEWIEWQEVSPDWYRPGHPYVMAITHTDDKEFVLTRLAGEGAVWELEDIIDAKREKVYRIPYQESRLIAATESDIWLGYRRGITRFDRKNDERIDYYVLPRFERISGWVDYDRKRYITTREGDFLVMDIDTGDISQLTIPEYTWNEMPEGLSIGYGSISDGKTMDTTFLYTNPVILGDTLYVGVLPANVLLLHNLNSAKWQTIELGEFFGISKLAVDKNMIWCIGNWQIGFEGGNLIEYGGLAAVTDRSKITIFPELNSYPIGGFRIDGDIVFALTDKDISGDASIHTQGGNYREKEPPEHRLSNFIFEISRKDMKVLDTYPVAEDSVEKNSFTPLQFSLCSDEQKALSLWRVKARIIELRDKEVDVLTKSDFNRE